MTITVSNIMFISRQTPLLTRRYDQYHTNLILSDIVFTV